MKHYLVGSPPIVIRIDAEDAEDAVRQFAIRLDETQKKSITRFERTIVVGVSSLDSNPVRQYFEITGVLVPDYSIMR